jgi:hypothetical protein
MSVYNILGVSKMLAGEKRMAIGGGACDAPLETLAAEIRRVANTLEAASPFQAFQLRGAAAMVEGLVDQSGGSDSAKRV